MIERYTPPAMRAVWSDEHKYELWLRIEVLACEAWASLGRIPESALPKIRKGTLDATKIAEVESRVGHDVIAFLTVLNESIGQPEARYVHIGMTSQDLNDTALAVQMVESARLITGDLAGVREAAADLALKHRKTLMAGRTHGIVAEPTTFGFKVAGWVAELDRSIERLEQAADEAAVGRVSGAVGTHATIDPRVEEHVCRELGLKVDEVSTQVVSRDRHASFMSAVAIAAGTLERIATEIRLLQRTEVGEVFEPFGKEQKGSSAMPHKRNPVLTERVCGLARVVRGNLLTALENTALWHERDISHSSAERVAFPDACAAVDYMALEMGKVLKGLEVRPERMLANLQFAGGVVFSQRVLLALVDSGLSREDAYLVVQKAAMRAMENAGDGFRELLEKNEDVTKRIGARMDQVFDPWAGLEHTDLAYERLGLGVTTK
ncbi:MAG: adenylosuccinate lyase [Chloroflexi bacterium]|nr:MAG: adenylosuccinate lyase [Chloroflexota bacterium]TMG20892.1 MAG: adenylosuccinate lyase [Chloroflexota bacterium]TMG67557.1 MAG: adenylosuccinate lyase [Chloroflexota bacterium]